MRVVNMRSSSRRCALLVGLVVIALVFSEVSAKREKESKKERHQDGKPSSGGRKSRGIWIGGDHQTGMDHGHGHGWMKLHNERHHDHSTKLSEAYVKFHGLGEKGNSRNTGILARLGNVIKALGIGRGDPEEENNSSGWGSSNNDNSNSNNNNNNQGGGGWGGGGMQQQQQQQSQKVLTITVPAAGGGGGGAGGGGGWGAPPPQMMSGGGSGGWGPPPSMMQMQQGWSNPQMQMVVAQPTGWASQQSQSSSSNSGGGGGSSKGGSGGNQRPASGWATGDFASFKPPRGSSNRNKGHFQLNFPTGKPAYIQKLKPIIDLPKIALHGWRR